MNLFISIIFFHNLFFISSQKITPLKKCCPEGEYFNITKLTCEYTKSIKLPYKIEFNWVPDCRNDSYLSTRKFSNYYKAIKSINEKENYCFDYCERESVILTCANKSKSRPAFRKCCPYGQGVANQRCEDDLQDFQTSFYNSEKNLTLNISVTLADFDLAFGDPCGNRSKFYLDPDFDEKEKSFLGTNGNLYSEFFNQPPYNKLLKENDFCLDYMANRSQENLITFVCFPETENVLLTENLLLIGICLIISCVFLFAIFLVYVCSPKRRNFYGKTLMCYVASLFVAYVCLAAAKLDISRFEQAVCKGIGYSMLFAFLSAFAWLNVMSIDIWKTFRKVRPRQTKSENEARFLLYSLYAWGLPLIITATCIAIDRIEYFSDSIIKPDIGIDSCWFSPHKYGIHLFFIAPTSVVITCNIIMYLMTAWRCWRVKREINRMSNHCKNKFSANKDQFILNGKLFIVMGVNWSLEIISFYLPHGMFYVTDLANALHGVILFVIFILKKKVLQDFLESLTTLHKRLKRISNPYSEVLTGNNGCNSPILRNSTTSSSVCRTTSTSITSN